MPAIIKIQQAPMEVTFKYGNVTRSKSKRGGADYFTFDCEQGRINADGKLGAAIAGNWAGRGGAAKIWKTEDGEYEVEVTDPAERIYDLEMRQWDDDANGFETIDMDFGVDGGKKTPSPDKPKAHQPASSGSAKTFEGYSELMAKCLEVAVAICGEEVTEQQQKIAVTLFMQADRKGITAESIGGESSDNTPQVQEEDNNAETNEEDEDLPF